ncbi:hypothetical protein jhhlp_001154 [Lomentospora prolificans]|uniref:Probable Xaa-Pro aminopeptidase P n=1 Tax=Lomentospora prolificans TaxID=41688 RepID=A0A2N3NHF1_9PEZI|nr:hypothetical protein jhhlp_001154 [Lomentospora prolificans]
MSQAQVLDAVSDSSGVSKTQNEAATTRRLKSLRDLMRQRNVDVYVIPSEDCHASEYIAACHARREYISCFTGSSGCAVVTQQKAILATDGRYFSQALKELDENWELLKQGTQDVPTWQEWTATEAAGGKIVAVDPSLISAPSAKKLSERIQRNGGAELLPLEENLVDLCWASDRPDPPANPVTILPNEFSGKDVQTKLSELRRELGKKNSMGFVISALDEVAWLFNLRGSDIPYNPVFFSYALITPTVATLYINKQQLEPQAVTHLESDGISIQPYDAFFSDVRKLRGGLKLREPPTGSLSSRFHISTKASWALKLALGGDENVEEIRSPITDAKAIKNSTEMDGMRACHVRDGVALIRFFAWLEHQLVNQNAVIDEVDAANKLEELRREQKDYVGLSFSTISSTGPNAAVIHYGPKPGSCSVIDPNAIYLCDSGAQYLDGTTDTTRTFHFGQPTDFEKRTYTLVLKGNISLDTAVFPKGTTGFALDTLARQHLWREGLDYRHGTGHGVGSYLNVHEGPIGIGTRVQYTEVALSPGNVVSIEPGYYEEGSFGIRIENVAIVKEVETPKSFGDKPYLGFEHVTMVPFCRNLLDIGLLTGSEKRWLNDYNAEILKKTKDLVREDPIALAWLERQTRQI